MSDYKWIDGRKVCRQKITHNYNQWGQFDYGNAWWHYKTGLIDEYGRKNRLEGEWEFTPSPDIKIEWEQDDTDKI